jgi:hypothetical protein
LARRRVGPQPFEVVKRALLGCENVDDDRAQIDQDPVPVGVALDVGDAVSAQFYRFDDAVGERARLNFGTSGHQDENVGQDRPRADVDRDKVLALFIQGGLAYEVE